MTSNSHLQAQLDLLQAALDHIDQGFSVFDADLRLVAWNRGLWELLDMPQELARRGTHLEDFLRVNAERGEYGPGEIEAKIQRRVERARKFESHYFERVRPNGQVIAVRGTPLPNGGFVTTYSDVTESRRRQEKLEKTVEERTRALRQSEDWLRLVTDNVPALIAYMAPGPVFRFANRRYAEWFGHSVASIVGRTGEEVAGVELYRELGPKIERALQGEVVSYEYTRERPDGTTAYMRSTLIPDMTLDGRTLGIFVLSLDASDQKRSEAALVQSQRMDAVGKLTGGLAHDFNNLLTILIGNLLSLKRKEGQIEAETLKSHLAPMLQATQRGADLTQRMLAFSRGQAVDPKSIAFSDVVDNVGTLLQGSLPSSISLNIDDVDPGLGACIDPTQMETALINLAFNARDAMPDGGDLRIRIKDIALGTGRADELSIEPGRYVVVSVSDTGIGMDEETRLRIFEPFFTTKPFGTGSGLGLSMVYGFMRQSKGAVEVISHFGRGTEFCLYFPATPVMVPDIATDTATDGETMTSLHGNGELLLVVEDDPDVASVLTDELAALGYSVLLAENAEDARSLAVELPDLKAVLSDIVMPGQMNGLALAKEIRAERQDLGIALMTGYADWSGLDTDASECEFPVLSKPFRNETLARTMKQIVNR